MRQKITKKGLYILLITFLFSIPVISQVRVISGKVTNFSGTPFPGVRIFIKGTNTGTISDFDGHYSLEVPDKEGEILVFHHLGYETREVPLKEGVWDVSVSLKEDILNLDEVIVTGSATGLKKKKYGNAISTISSNELEKTGAASIDKALSGKVPGALISQNSGNPAGGISVTLRGNSTVLGSSDPLYIIDGVIIDNSSPEILDLGGYAQNRLVDINPDDVERVEILKGASAAAIYGSRASNGVVQIFTKKGHDAKTRLTFSTSFITNEIRKKIDENTVLRTYADPTDAINSLYVPVEKRYRIQDYIFTSGYGTDNYIALRGGDKKTTWFLSGSFLYNEGIIKNTDFRRISSRLNLSHKFNEYIKIGTGLSYTNSHSDEKPNGGITEFYGALTGFNFNSNYYDPDPNASGKYPTNSFASNPLEVIDLYKFDQNISRITGNIRLDITTFKGFSIDYTLGFDTYSQGATGFIPKGSTGTYPNGWAKTAEYHAMLLNNDLNFKYTTDIGPQISSATIAGASVQYNRLRRLAITAVDLSPLVKTTNGGTVSSRGDFRLERSIQGAFIQQTFGFFDTFFITGAFRFDTASTFGKEERFQLYPKTSLSYLVSEENFWRSVRNIVSTFKLRASYGEAGNLSALGAYERLSNYNPVPIGGQTGLVPDSRKGNENLTPEKQKEFEAGADIGLFGNRIGMEFTYYNVQIEELLLERVLAPTTGFSSRLENIGTMTNKGIELLLKANPVTNEKFKWNLSATFSMNKNEVNDIEGGMVQLPKSFGISVAKNGYPIGVFNGFYFARNADGTIITDSGGLPSRALDENGDVDRKIIGDPNPDWTGSFSNNLHYKNFNLSFQFDVVQGFDVFNFTDRVQSRPQFGGGPREGLELSGELPRGYNDAAYNIWERYIEDGSFIKLREVALRYTFKPENSPLKTIEIALTGRNLFSIDNYSGWDPEVSTAGQTNGVRGFDFNEVPVPRTYQLGIKVNF